MILVIGGTGLLGSHLLFELMKTQKKVKCLYRDSSKINKVRKLFDYYSNDKTHRFDEIEWIKGDLLDLVSLNDAFENVSEVYHCAAFVSFVRNDFKKMLNVNCRGTANVVNFALKYKVKKLAYVSSTATICSNSKHSPTTEKDRCTNSSHTSGYALSKYNAEREVWRASEEGLNVVIINPSIIFGATEFMDSSMAIFKTVQDGLILYSPGSNAFVDARNVAECLVKLMDSNIMNERFLCVGTNTSFKNMLEILANVLNVRVPSKCVPKWLAIFAGRISETFALFSRKQPKITLETMRSAYSNEEYSNEKISKAIDISWYSLEESFQNAKKFQQWNINKSNTL